MKIDRYIVTETPISKSMVDEDIWRDYCDRQARLFAHDHYAQTPYADGPFTVWHTGPFYPMMGEHAPPDALIVMTRIGPTALVQEDDMVTL